MACYNGRNWIEDQINSILLQDSVEITILIRDDGSNDGTYDFLQKTYGNNNNIQIRRNEITSGSAGANFRKLFGDCDLSFYNYVALSDQDDIWHVNKLKNAITELNKKNASGYSCSVNAFWTSGKILKIEQSTKVSKYDFLFEGYGQGCTYVITVELFKKIIEFCKTNASLVEQLHYHDWLIYLLARAWGHTWIYEKKPYVLYRQHINNEIGARSGVNSIYTRLKLIKNGWFKEQINAAVNITKKANQFALPVKINSRIEYLYIILIHGRKKKTDRFLMFIAGILGLV